MSFKIYSNIKKIFETPCYFIFLIKILKNVLFLKNVQILWMKQIDWELFVNVVFLSKSRLLNITHDKPNKQTFVTP